MAVDEIRKRYIGFIIKGGRTDRRGMITAIRDSFSYEDYNEYKPWLTVFEGDKGIVRCSHTGKEKVVKVLNSMEVGGGKVETVTTSGTIKKVKKRLSEYE